MKKIIIPILFVFALAATSCEKLLDIPQKGVISYSNFFKSDADAQAARTNMYATFSDNVASCQGGWIFVPQLMILNYSADDVLAAGGNSEDHGDFRVFCEDSAFLAASQQKKNIVFCIRLAQKFRYLQGIPPNADAKVMLFSELTNFLGVFFLKKFHFIENSMISGD